MPSFPPFIFAPLCLLWLSLLVALPAQSQEAARDTTAVKASALRAELLAMRTADQAMRAEVTAFIQASEGQPDVWEFMSLKERLDSLDTTHATRMRDIIDEHGWPGPPLVGEDGTAAAFLIVQHADLALQQEALPLVREAYANGALSGQALALLTDRVRVGEGEPQLYGTQATVQQGKLTVHPIADSAQVDQRRATLGLPPLSAYIDTLRGTYMQHQGSDN
ncbi:MAG: hypothetical protein GVY12_06845 [Bacteroidetes bacterium]|jgi:hypothetical protein|nr:hypothetical protein [Bacteroidota bacterium]